MSEESKFPFLRLFEQLRAVLPRDAGVASRARKHFLARVDTIGASRRDVLPSMPDRIKALGKPRRFAWVAASIWMAVALILGGTGVAYASQTALPADPLYRLKIALEDLQLTLSSDEAAESYLLLQFIQRRVDEMAGLAELQRFEDISISVARYNNSLLQLTTIILDYIEQGDPRAQELITLLAEALADNESTLSSLVAVVPVSANSNIELAIQVSEEVSESEELTSGESDRFSGSSAEIKDIEPDKAPQGQTLNVEIVGENAHFSTLSIVNFIPADGIHVNSVTVISPTSIIVNLTIDPSASLGDRQVVVTTQGETLSGELFRVEEKEFEDTSGEGEEGEDGEREDGEGEEGEGESGEGEDGEGPDSEGEEESQDSESGEGSDSGNEGPSGESTSEADAGTEDDEEE